MSWFETNSHGTWCCGCGELLSRRDEDFDGEECPTCGFPEDAEMMAQFFGGEDFDEEDSTP